MKILLEEKPSKHKVIVEDKFIKVNESRSKISVIKIILPSGPHFDIEPANCSDTYFLWRSKGHRLVGLVKSGQLVRSSRNVEKVHYLSKLDLIPASSPT